ncbi:serine hydrolase domain-containing protein [Kitasatospora sp. NPDC058046]|uniref:serine hydrolase domain-containing protein n=1 Tax=Kitasatospora sp. NPDC058046 TaxID=3346312 RepID=UPI0036DCCEB6
MRNQAQQTVHPSRHRKVLVAAMAVGALTTGVLAPTTAFAAPKPDTVQQGLDALVRDDGIVGTLANVEKGHGRARNYTAGVGDLATGAKVPVDGQVRMGSNTKTFTAVVVLQLVGEGKIGLDAPVETYLPGLVRGDGIDGRNITVRQLLQHTSGLPEYLRGDASFHYYEPRDLLDNALRFKADFAPGDRFNYSNTNYLVAGLIVQRVTGRPLAAEIDRRIVKPVGLRHTYFPTPGDTAIREPHPKGYYREAPDAPQQDVTETDPSFGWAAGQMISTNSDLNHFFSALLHGGLLPPAQLAEMKKTVPAEAVGPGAAYGLGLVSRPLPCGGLYWGHGGSFPGYETRGGVTEDGSTAANIAVTSRPTDKAALRHVENVVEAALCR